MDINIKRELAADRLFRSLQTAAADTNSIMENETLLLRTDENFFAVRVMN